MAFPNCTITIYPDGKDAQIESLEHSPQCHKLSELGQRAGKVTSNKTKDHPPVTQHVVRK